MPCICLDAMIRLEEVTSWSKKCMLLDRRENMNKNAAKEQPWRKQYFDEINNLALKRKALIEKLRT